MQKAYVERGTIAFEELTALSCDGAAVAGATLPFGVEAANEYTDVAAAKRNRSHRILSDAIQRYGMAFLCVAGALLTTFFLQHFFPYPFLFLFFAAVMSSAWLGGTGPGLFAVFLSTIVVEFCFVPPFYSFAMNATDVSYFAAFIVCSLAASWVSASKKKSEEALRETRNQLEIRVAMRTEQLQRSNTELRESERQLRVITEVIPQQIWSGRPDGSIDYCNQQLLDYAGCALDDIRGERFIGFIHPEDQQGFRIAWQRAVTTETAFEGECRVRRADGQYRWFFTRAVPLRRAEGKTVRWYGTNTDIEEHKKAEQALLQTQANLAHLSRVLTMGELTASIAHEVNQPLTALVTDGYACLEWLSGEKPDLAEAQATAERIIKSATRAGAIIGRIRALFKKEPPLKACVDMNDVIVEMVVFLRGEAAREQIAMRTDLAPDLPRVTGDRVQLQQVVLNLIVNGMDAIHGAANTGTKELVVRSRKASATEIAIAVEDTGIGLNDGATEKLFEPFFTTKSKGLGMGLSISRSIVESHEGRLWAAPRPAGGAIFQFTVPVSS